MREKIHEIQYCYLFFCLIFIRHKEHDDEERGNREQTFDGQKNANNAREN